MPGIQRILKLVTVYIILLLHLNSQVIEAEEISRTSNVHQVYYEDQPSGGPSDWSANVNPYSRNKKFKEEESHPQYYDSYYGPQQNLQSPYLLQEKDYGYSSKPATKGKDKDHLWEFFESLFDKKKELEEEIWDLIFHKGGEKGHGGYAEPPSSGYHGDHKTKAASKEKVFEKIKFLAIAATVLLIVLGGGILLAPLAIGKGRRRSLSEFFPAQNSLLAPTEIAQLAAKVFQAIQQYQQQQQLTI